MAKRQAIKANQIKARWWLAIALQQSASSDAVDRCQLRSAAKQHYLIIALIMTHYRYFEKEDEEEEDSAQTYSLLQGSSSPVDVWAGEGETQLN